MTLATQLLELDKYKTCSMCVRPDRFFDVLDTPKDKINDFLGDFHDVDHDGPEDDRLDRENK